MEWTPIMSGSFRVSQSWPRSVAMPMVNIWRGLVERVSHRIGNNLVLDFSPLRLVNIRRAEQYISLESALAEGRISTQLPSGQIYVTTGLPRLFASRSVRVTIARSARTCVQVSRKTRFGATRLRRRKDFVDCVYLSFQVGLRAAHDELESECSLSGKC